MRALISALIGAMGMAAFHYWMGLPMWLTLVLSSVLAVVVTPVAGEAIEGRAKRRQIRK